MKLGVSYIVFDGTELLEHSINTIRDHVDYIQVITQDMSWFGDYVPKDSYKILHSLKDRKIIDELTNFKAFIPLKSYNQHAILQSKEYERSKRQLGLTTCFKNKCTHFLCMDVDEFYVENQFIEAKKYIIENNIDLSAVDLINYVNIPTLHRGYSPYSVPFICKINSNSKMGRHFFTKCDPTRGIINLGKSKTHHFSRGIITMHHMENVRKDLMLKYKSTTRGIFKREDMNDLVYHIKSTTSAKKGFDFKKIIFPGTNPIDLIEVDNIFKIPYDTW